MNDLTEQWDKGKLPNGDYYIKIRNGEVFYDNIDYDGVWRNSLDEDIVEVLAPVPSYNEYKRLQEQLNDANEVIKKYAYPKSVHKITIENQEVCEVIAFTEPKEGLDYLEKWGVK